jgi:hypothetical protein
MVYNTDTGVYIILMAPMDPIYVPLVLQYNEPIVTSTISITEAAIVII